MSELYKAIVSLRMKIVKKVERDAKQPWSYNLKKGYHYALELAFLYGIFKIVSLFVDIHIGK